MFILFNDKKKKLVDPASDQKWWEYKMYLNSYKTQTPANGALQQLGQGECRKS